jgi:hypothetical protein
VTSSIVTVVVTLVVALHLAAIIDVALMPAWAWRGAADAPKRRWIVLLALIPGWAVVYYRSSDRREVRNHLFRCGGVEPDWHARTPSEPRAGSVFGGAVATMKDRRLVRELLTPGTDPAPGSDLVPIHWHANRVAGPGLRLERSPWGADDPLAPAGPLPPIRWYAEDHMLPAHRALPAPAPRLRLTA